MRVTVLLIVCIIVLVGLIGWWAVSAIHTTGDILISELEGAIAAAKMGDYSSCRNYVYKLLSDWEKVKWEWELIIDHHELDHIQFALAQLEMLADMENEDFLTQAAGLLYDIKHIKAKELPSFENVF